MMRHKNVVVAIVQDASQKFLVVYNEKWHGYAFPMQDFAPDGMPTGRIAIEAVEKDLGCQLPYAKAEELEFLGTFGHSVATDAETWYDYWVFSVDPCQTLDLTKSPTVVNNPPQFFTADELRNRTGLTWSTPRIAQELLDKQDAVVSVVTRPGKAETEYLVIENSNYGGYFFPVTRLKNELKPHQIAEKLVRTDLGYRAEVHAEWRAEVLDIHFSSRYQQDRLYRFQVCSVELPQIDLMQPYNPLELALSQRGKRSAWLTASELQENVANHSVSLSSTMQSIAASVLRIVPPRPRTDPLRKSEGGIALIERTVNGEQQWLAQWNDNWNAFFFVGGHREPNESFRDCVIREVCEELDVQPADFTVADTSIKRLEYIATSRGAEVPTAYTMEPFATQLAPAIELAIDSNSKNAWLTEQDVRSLTAGGVRPISVTMLVVLVMLGHIKC
ncbi:MAG: hypothetical protein JWM11_3597 [Planctomycetaceae bacterium]|nr:hypothetical protein [Planctomycetaceae bacterium]